MRQLIFFIVFCCSANLNAQNLILASDTWPPFTDKEGQVHFAQDIVLEALKRNNKTAEVKIIEFGEVMIGLKDSKFDGSAALWKNETREELLIFSDPYLQNRMVLVGRKGSSVGYKELADLRGKKLAIVESYDYGPELTDLKTINIATASSDQQCLNMLLAGKVDYILLDNLLAHQLKEYRHIDVDKYLAIGSKSLLNKPLHFAIRKDINDAESIIKQFNEAIDEMLMDGTYNEILNIDWILADIDKDGIQEVVLGGNEAGLTPPDNLYEVIIGSDEMLDSETNNQEYYVDGKIYNDWNEIPKQYKTQTFSNPNEFNFLQLNINKNK